MHLWRLFNSHSSSELISADADQLKSFIAEVLPEAERKFWQLRQDGEDHWQSAQSISGTPTPGQGLRTLASVPREDRRQLPRASLKCRILVSSEGRRFESWTKNISLRGMLLEHKLPPEFQDQLCHALLSMPQGDLSLRVQARVGTSGNKGSRLVFSEADGRLLARLGTWLQSRKTTMPLRKAA